MPLGIRCEELPSAAHIIATSHPRAAGLTSWAPAGQSSASGGVMNWRKKQRRTYHDLRKFTGTFTSDSTGLPARIAA
jgi:hypothetical protein